MTPHTFLLQRTVSKVMAANTEQPDYTPKRNTFFIIDRCLVWWLIEIVPAATRCATE